MEFKVILVCLVCSDDRSQSSNSKWLRTAASVKSDFRSRRERSQQFGEPVNASFACSLAFITKHVLFLN